MTDSQNQTAERILQEFVLEERAREAEEALQKLLAEIERQKLPRVTDPNQTAERPVKRGHFEATSEPSNWQIGCYEDGALEITSGDQGIAFHIDDEAAAGSYNISVTASCRLLRSEAERLRDWLTEILS